MYASCKICGYDTGDLDNVREVKEEVEKNGGYLAINSMPQDNNPNICPYCKAVNTLRVD